MPLLNETYHHIDEEKTDFYSRRLFLRHIFTLGTAGLIIPGLLAACNNEARGETETGKTSPGDRGAALAHCETERDPSWAEDVTRQSIKYVDESPYADKVCANCQFFKQPEASSACGGCQIVQGPIAPAGYCNAWVIKT